MPFLLPAAATAVAAGGTAAATAAATATATAAATASFTTIATNALINLAISAAMSALSPQVGSAGRPIDWILDPDAPIPFAAGRVGVAGSVVHKATFGPDLMYYGFVSVLSGAGPIKSFQTFKADEETVTFDGNGKAISSQWRDEMWMRFHGGFQPAIAAMTSPPGLKNGALLPAWGASNRLDGKAAYMLVMGENSKRSAYPNGEVKPLWVIEGLYGWDPRQDSTYPGGSGGCRLNDSSTWVYLTNPILWGLKWALGLWEGPTGKGAPQVDYQVGGIGAKVEGIDVASFVAGANVADANGWTVAAYPNTDDDKAQVLDSFLQAGGCIYAQKAGKISCIQRAAPRTSIVTISAEDTAGPLEIDTAASRINRINTLRPRFWSEGNRWQMTAIEEVTASTYQTEDGGKRTRSIDFPFVPDATQAAQLAALQIANTREGIAGVIPLKPHLQRITPGDAFTITEAGFVLNGLKCLCLNTDYDPATGIHRVTFVSETDAKYPFALGQWPVAPSSPTLTPVDPTFVSPPGTGDWTVTPRPPGTGGGLPIFDLTGAVNNATATAIIVEWGLTNNPTDAGNWRQAYEGPPTATNIPLVGIQPGQVYYVAVRNRRDGNYSARAVYGPYTAPALVAGDVLGTSPTIQALDADIVDLVNAQASETLIRTQSVNTITARNSNRPNLIDNPSGAAGFRSWIKEGGPNSAAVPDQQALRIFLVTDYIVSRVYPATPGQQHSLSYNAAPVGGGGVRVQYVTGTGLVEGVNVPNTATSSEQRLRSSAPSTAPAGTTGFRLVVAPPPGGATLPVWSIKVNFGSTASDFTDDYTSLEVQSEVTITSLAVADIEAQQALAYYQVVAAATGGRPARLRLISSSLGSAVALEAPYIYFGDNTVFDDATDTLQSVTGSVVSVIAWGADFGTALRQWVGPTGIPLSSMTRANAYFYIASSTPFVGGNGLGAPLTATLSLSSVFGGRSGAGFAATNSVTVTVSGGPAGTPTVRWAKVLGSNNIAPSNETGLTTNFGGTVTAGQTLTAGYVAYVTQGGQTAVTAILDVAVADTT